MVNLVVIFNKKNKGNTFFHNFESYEEMRGCDVIFAFEHKKSTKRFWRQLHPMHSFDDCKFLFMRDYLKETAKKLFNKEFQIYDWVECNFCEFEYKDAMRVIKLGQDAKDISLKP